MKLTVSQTLPIFPAAERCKRKYECLIKEGVQFNGWKLKRHDGIVVWVEHPICKSAAHDKGVRTVPLYQKWKSSSQSSFRPELEGIDDTLIFVARSTSILQLKVCVCDPSKYRRAVVEGRRCKDMRRRSVSRILETHIRRWEHVTFYDCNPHETRG